MTITRPSRTRLRALACALPLAVLAAPAAFAQGITPFQAEPVRPRTAEAVKPRPAPPVQPVRARPVAPVAPVRPSPAADDPAPPVAGGELAPDAADWRWQRVSAPPPAGGVGRGMWLENVACAGARCEAFESTGGDPSIRVEARFANAAGSWLDVSTMREGDSAPREQRRRGAFSDGSFNDLVSTYRLEPGRYVVGYAVPGASRLLAAVRFDVRKPATGASDSGGRTGAAARPVPNADGHAAAERQRRLQACLMQAATNPDVRCVY